MINPQRPWTLLLLSHSFLFPQLRCISHQWDTSNSNTLKCNETIKTLKIKLAEESDKVMKKTSFRTKRKNELSKFKAEIKTFSFRRKYLSPVSLTFVRV